MRQKSNPVFCFEWAKASHHSELKIVKAHQEKYKGISAILDESPLILDLADRDLKGLSQGGKKGRKGAYTSENILRALIVHTLEGLDLRSTIVRISESPFLQDFLRLGNRRVMDFTFLDKAFKAIRSETWKQINAALAGYARETERMDPSQIRVDTTVVETNIHYPTDASLLWDSWRVLARLLREGRSLAPGMRPHRFHDKKVKKLFLRITRYVRSRSKFRRRLVRKCFRDLIGQVRRIVSISEGFCAQARLNRQAAVRAVADEIESFLGPIRTVAATSERANVKGETVPAAERVFSLFEPHTELIKRGKSHKPVEFGHVIVLSETKEKFISDYDVMARRIPDSELAEQRVKNHEDLFGEPPEVLTADTGFNPKAQKRAALEEKVETLAIPRRVRDWVDVISACWQRFRAGIEGTISVLKRAYRLLRCPFRGFKSFAASIGMSIFCHNLVVLARPPGN